MGISIFYTARRDHPLTATEHAAIEAIIQRHSVAEEARRYRETGDGPNWEDFCVYPENEWTEPGVIFEGATRLPDRDEDELWAGVLHWCRALSLIRTVLPDATWGVHIDDHEIAWSPDLKVFDPSV